MGSDSSQEEGDRRLVVKLSSVARTYDGLWVCLERVENLAEWVRALLIKDGEVVDGLGTVLHLELSQDEKVMLCGVELRLIAGDELLRIGRSGIELKFRRADRSLLALFCEAEGYIPGALPTSQRMIPALAKWLDRHLVPALPSEVPARLSP